MNKNVYFSYYLKEFFTVLTIAFQITLFLSLVFLSIKYESLFNHCFYLFIVLCINILKSHSINLILMYELGPWTLWHSVFSDTYLSI